MMKEEKLAGRGGREARRGCGLRLVADERGVNPAVVIALPREAVVKIDRLPKEKGRAFSCTLMCEQLMESAGNENHAKKTLTKRHGVSNLSNIHWKPMPDQPSPDKVSLSVRVPRTLSQRLKKLAAQRGEPVSELVTWLFTRATNEVELTPDDYRQIAEDTERAARLLAAKGSARKALDARYKKSEGGK